MASWLNRTAGILARNGTSSHTLTFSTDGDAPFTPTNGRLLVVVVAGGVTHSWPGGWTEQLQPVNNAELSVATATASSTSSVTITHNGSNYPVAYAAYEFASNASWVTGVGASNTASTAASPDLSGLPGTAVSVFWSACSTIPTDTSARDATWTAPAVEDVDLYTAGAATDGVWLTVAVENNVTTTTKTGATPTINTTGTAINPERVSFAIAPGTSGASLAPTAISSSEAFGSDTLTTGVVSIGPTGLTSIEVFGTNTLTVGAVSMSPTGIASAQAFGRPRFNGAVPRSANGFFAVV